MTASLRSAGTVAVGGTTVAPTYGTPTLAGNTAIAMVGSNISTGSLAVSGAGWVQAVQVATTASAVAIFYKPNISAGETAPTFTNGNSRYFGLLTEFQGLLQVSPLDQTGVNHATTSVSSLTATAGGVDKARGGLVISAGVAEPATGTITWSDTFNNGTIVNLAKGQVSSTAYQYDLNYAVLTSNTAADSWHQSIGTATATVWQLAIASFKTILPPPFTKPPRYFVFPTAVRSVTRAVIPLTTSIVRRKTPTYPTFQVEEASPAIKQAARTFILPAPAGSIIRTRPQQRPPVVPQRSLLKQRLNLPAPAPKGSIIRERPQQRSAINPQLPYPKAQSSQNKQTVSTPPVFYKSYVPYPDVKQRPPVKPQFSQDKQTLSTPPPVVPGNYGYTPDVKQRPPVRPQSSQDRQTLSTPPPQAPPMPPPEPLTRQRSPVKPQAMYEKLILSVPLPWFTAYFIPVPKQRQTNPSRALVKPEGVKVAPAGSIIRILVRQQSPVRPQKGFSRPPGAFRVPPAPGGSVYSPGVKQRPLPPTRRSLVRQVLHLPPPAPRGSIIRQRPQQRPPVTPQRSLFKNMVRGTFTPPPTGAIIFRRFVRALPLIPQRSSVKQRLNVPAPAPKGSVIRLRVQQRPPTNPQRSRTAQGGTRAVNAYVARLKVQQRPVSALRFRPPQITYRPKPQSIIRQQAKQQPPAAPRRPSVKPRFSYTPPPMTVPRALVRPGQVQPRRGQAPQGVRRTPSFSLHRILRQPVPVRLRRSIQTEPQAPRISRVPRLTSRFNPHPTVKPRSGQAQHIILRGIVIPRRPAVRPTPPTPRRQVVRPVLFKLAPVIPKLPPGRTVPQAAKVRIVRARVKAPAVRPSPPPRMPSWMPRIIPQRWVRPLWRLRPRVPVYRPPTPADTIQVVVTPASTVGAVQALSSTTSDIVVTPALTVDSVQATTPGEITIIVTAPGQIDVTQEPT